MITIQEKYYFLLGLKILKQIFISNAIFSSSFLEYQIIYFNFNYSIIDISSFTAIFFLELFNLNELGKQCGGACGVKVIVVGNGHGDTSSNLGRD